MAIRIVFLGELGARLGREHELDGPESGLTVAEIRRRLCETVEGACETLGRSDIRAALDHTLVADAARVRPGQELAFLPVFSGG